MSYHAVAQSNARANPPTRIKTQASLTKAGGSVLGRAGRIGEGIALRLRTSHRSLRLVGESEGGSAPLSVVQPIHRRRNAPLQPNRSWLRTQQGSAAKDQRTLSCHITGGAGGLPPVARMLQQPVNSSKEATTATRDHVCALTQGLQGVLSTGGERERGAVRRHNESRSNTEANQEADGSD